MPISNLTGADPNQNFPGLAGWNGNGQPIDSNGNVISGGPLISSPQMGVTPNYLSQGQSNAVNNANSGSPSLGSNPLSRGLGNSIGSTGLSGISNPSPTASNIEKTGLPNIGVNYGAQSMSNDSAPVTAGGQTPGSTVNNNNTTINNNQTYTPQQYSNPYGTSGVNYSNGYSNSFGPSFNSESGGNPQYDAQTQANVQAYNQAVANGTLDPRLAPGGGWSQVGGSEYLNNGQWNQYNIKDPSRIQYDPNLGFISPTDNFVDHTGTIDRYAPAVIQAALMGPAAGAALGDLGLSNPLSSGPGDNYWNQYAGNDPSTLTDGVPEGAPTDAPTPGGSGVGNTLSNLYNNPITRFVGGQLVNPVLSALGIGGAAGANNSAARNMPLNNYPGNNYPGTPPINGDPTQQPGGTNNPGNGNGGNPYQASITGNPTLDSLLQGGANMYQDNQQIQQYQNMVNQYMNRGDYNAQYRPGELSQLNQLLTNPSDVINNDPSYQAARSLNISNVDRQLNATGYKMSGNEMAELQNQGKILDENYIGQHESQLRAAAQLGNPDQMARAGILTLPFLFQMAANRNAAANGIFQRGFPGAGRGNGTNPDGTRPGGSGPGEEGGVEVPNDPGNGDVTIDDPGYNQNTYDPNYDPNQLNQDILNSGSGADDSSLWDFFDF